MASLNKKDYVDHYIQEMNLSEDQKLLLQELDGKPVVLPNNFVQLNTNTILEMVAFQIHISVLKELDPVVFVHCKHLCWPGSLAQ